MATQLYHEGVDPTDAAPVVDCFGLRWLRPHPQGRTDEFLIAEPTAALHMRQTSGPFDRDYAPCGAPVGVVAAVATHRGPVHVLESLVGEVIAASVQLEWVPHGIRVAPGLPRVGRSPSAADRGSLALAHMAWPHVRFVQVGDAAAFVRRGARLEPLFPSAIQGGSSDAELHPCQAVTIELALEDEIVLCSAAVSKWVRCASMATALAKVRTVEEACQELLTAAAAERGDGDMTAVVARFRAPC